MESIDGELISRVKEMLYSYNEAGFINDNILGTWSKYIINRFGIGAKSEENEILEVEDYEALLPENFSILWSLQKCKQCNDSGIITHRYYSNSRPLTVVHQNLVDRVCYNKCEIDRTQTYITQRMYIESKIYERHFCERTLLSPSKKINKNRCSELCANFYSKSPNMFGFKDDKTLEFNFKDGVVLLEYYADMVDENGFPMLSEKNEYDMKALEDYLIFMIFKQLLFNSQADVLGLYREAKAEYLVSLAEAEKQHKVPKFTKMINYARAIPKHLETFNLPSNADRIHKPNKKFGYR